ncbi:MAG: hypothetical protein WCQ50_00200 [Spirochaetota bacterium]
MGIILSPRGIRAFGISGSRVIVLLAITMAAFATMSCSNILAWVGLGQTGSLQVELQQSGSGSRTILPPVVLPTDLLFDLALARGTASITATGLSADKLALSAIPPSEGGKSDWTLTARGKKGALSLFSGSLALTINVGANTATLILAPLQTSTGMGDLVFTLSWPHNLLDASNSGDSVALYWTPNINEAETRADAARMSGDSVSTTLGYVQKVLIDSTKYKIPIASGNYFLVIDLKKSGLVVASVMEMVRIFDGQTSIGTVALDELDISSPPDAPTFCRHVNTGVPMRGSAPVDGSLSIRFDWTDVSDTETEYRIYDDTTSTLLVTLPFGTEYHVKTSLDPFHNYSIAAANAFGESLRVPCEDAGSLGITVTPATIDLIGPAEIIDGASVSYTAVPEGMTGSASCQWYVNGEPVGANADSLGFIVGQRVGIEAGKNRIGVVATVGGRNYSSEMTVTCLPFDIAVTEGAVGSTITCRYADGKYIIHNHVYLTAVGAIYDDYQWSYSNTEDGDSGTLSFVSGSCYDAYVGDGLLIDSSYNVTVKVRVSKGSIWSEKTVDLHNYSGPQ